MLRRIFSAARVEAKADASVVYTSHLLLSYATMLSSLVSVLTGSYFILLDRKVIRQVKFCSGAGLDAD